MFLAGLAIFGVLGFGYALLFPTVGFRQNKADEYFRDGLLLYTDYRYDAAISRYLESLSVNPDFSLARRFLGNALYFSGQVDEAASEWKSLLDTGVYDLPLQSHLQALSSVRLVDDRSIFYSHSLKRKAGFRLEHPVFLSSGKNGSVFLLSIGQTADASLVEISANEEYDRVLRRISGKLEVPMGLAMGAKEIWVTDYKTDRIHRLSKNVRQPIPFVVEIDYLGGKENNDSLLRFRAPAGICFSQGYFYVADSGNNRVLKISEEKPQEATIFLGTEKPVSKSEIDGFQNPFGIACLEDGGFFISEPERARVGRYDRYGNFLYNLYSTKLVKPRHLSVHEKTLVVADEVAGVFLFNLDGSLDKHIQGKESQEGHQNFLRAYSAIIDNFGNLFVADYAAHEVAVFHPESYRYSNLEVWIERVNAAMFPNIGVYVSVKDNKGKYINVLNESNFEIFENDAVVLGHRSDYLKQFQDEITGVLLLSRDKKMSEYSGTSKWLLSFVASRIRERDKIKIASYSQDSQDESEYTNSFLKMNKSVNDIINKANSSNVNAGKALYRYLNELLAKKGRRFIIWIYEGGLEMDSFAQFSMSRIENFARNNHIPIFIFDFQHPDTNKDLEINARLDRFAQYTGGKRFQVFKDLKDIQNLLRNIPENRYVINFHSGVDKDWVRHFMELKVKVTFKDRIGIETSGYVIPDRR